MEVRVCIGDFCHLQGSEIVTRVFMELAEQEQLGPLFDFKGVFCLGKCQEEGVSVRVGDRVHKVNRDNAEEFFREVILPAVRAKA
ncbi:MAG TPA: (2Fe-2S) ferredoxin domain-containing protein [Rectinemataceae bacterium]|nr:(2Fe-2S) ferredoxin domain-containing protein [Rectinemataceae bacterium]